MTKLKNREIRLVSHPKGLPTTANFSLVTTDVGPIQKQQVLVRNLFMSVDPYMRGRMNEGKSYTPPFEIGKPLDGSAVGEVIESNAAEFKPGDAVLSSFGWREYIIASPTPLPGPSNLFYVIGKRLTIKGMIVSDWLDRQEAFTKEVGSYFQDEKIKNHETVVDGIDKAVDAFLGLFQGQNTGKMIVKMN